MLSLIFSRRSQSMKSPYAPSTLWTGSIIYRVRYADTATGVKTSRADAKHNNFHRQQVKMYTHIRLRRARNISIDIIGAVATVGGHLKLNLFTIFLTKQGKRQATIMYIRFQRSWKSNNRFWLRSERIEPSEREKNLRSLQTIISEKLHFSFYILRGWRCLRRQRVDFINAKSSKFVFRRKIFHNSPSDLKKYMWMFYNKFHIVFFSFALAFDSFWQSGEFQTLRNRLRSAALREKNNKNSNSSNYNREMQENMKNVFQMFPCIPSSHVSPQPNSSRILTTISLLTPSDWRIARIAAGSIQFMSQW